MDRHLQPAIEDYCVMMTCSRCPMNLGDGVYICNRPTREKKQEYVDIAIKTLLEAGYDLPFINILQVTEEDVLAIFSE